MRISIKTGAKGVTVQTSGEGFMAAVDAVAALIKIGYWGRLYNRGDIFPSRGSVSRRSRDAFGWCDKVW